MRTFSMSAGLDASTDTPGSTAPVVSLTVPAIAPVVDDCAAATDGSHTAARSNAPRKPVSLIIPPSKNQTHLRFAAATSELDDRADLHQPRPKDARRP